jgi:uncharacterized protein
VIVVVDSSPLITLARIGRLELLHEAAEVIHIPEAVFVEVVHRGAGRPGSAEVAQADWVKRRTVRDTAFVGRLRTRLGRGESEAIVLAKELGADFLVIDDAAARQSAEAEGQRVVGLLGWLIYLKQRGVVSEVKPVLDDMRASGFYLDDPGYRSILRRADEQ